MKLMFVSDAWFPQVNGVVTTMSTVIETLRNEGHEVDVIQPSQFYTVPMPTYPEIRLSMDVWRVGEKIARFKPDRLHIVTEGPLGLAAMRYMSRRGMSYTTAFHTKFPEYTNARFPFVTVPFGYRVMHAFHKHSERVMVATDSVRKELEHWGFDNVVTWSRGVDTSVFRPLDADDENPLAHLDGKVAIYVGRIAPEKNIQAFLDVDYEGHKVVVGDGPSRAKLEAQYPHVHFVGYQKGRDLARYFAAADVFVFPSLTDTYGVVMLEAMACGTPVAAFPVSGPLDVVNDGVTGVLDEDLSRAMTRAERLSSDDCIAQARSNNWEKTAQFLLRNMVPANWSQQVQKVASAEGAQPSV
ncbi:glycosyltransferase [gamma proteobacterium HTCC5015]|nr:glycosyltransferase [gamma proteobacterium HTCC5015]